MKTQKTRNTIYTVGYQGKSLEQLLDILKQIGITLLVDLRERPYGRKPEFNQKRLMVSLRGVKIKYEWMGRSLGGFTCTKQQWLEGCEKLAPLAGDETVAIMCMEADHTKCHRKDIAELLAFFHNVEYVNL